MMEETCPVNAAHAVARTAVVVVNYNTRDLFDLREAVDAGGEDVRSRDHAGCFMLALRTGFRF